MLKAAHAGLVALSLTPLILASPLQLAPRQDSSDPINDSSLFPACASGASLGISCASNDACESGTCCWDGGVNRCVQPAQDSDDGCVCIATHTCWNGECIPTMLEDGQECRVDRQCTSGKCIAGTASSFCGLAALLDDGTPCSSGAQCKSGACAKFEGEDQATCYNPNTTTPGTTIRPPGGPCSRDDQCSTNTCREGICADTDAVKKDNGASCSAANVCKSGACTDGKCAAAQQQEEETEENDEEQPSGEEPVNDEVVITVTSPVTVVADGQTRTEMATATLVSVVGSSATLAPSLASAATLLLAAWLVL